MWHGHLGKRNKDQRLPSPSSKCQIQRRLHGLISSNFGLLKSEYNSRNKARGKEIVAFFISHTNPFLSPLQFAFNGVPLDLTPRSWHEQEVCSIQHCRSSWNPT